MADSSREEIAKLEALYANNPAGRVFTHLAEAYRKAGEYERARGILNEGLQKHPGYASAYVVMGRVLMDLQEHDEAANAFRHVLDLDPHNLVALQSLGELARTAGRSEEAIHYFEELRQHDPGNDQVEQIINDLRPAAQPEWQAEPVASAETESDTASRTEEWRPDSTGYEPEESAWTEPGVETASETSFSQTAQPGAEREPDSQDQAAEQPEPWLSESTPGEQTDTAEFASPFAQEPSAHDFSLGWVDQEPQPETVPDSGELGDLTSIGKAASELEIVGETFASEDLDLGISGREGESTEEPAFAEGEVLTETIAELYRRQGLYERAADVYRALLKSSPDNADLHAKLAEVEALSHPVERDAVPADPWRERDPWETADADTEDTAPWLAGGSVTAESSPTPYAWTEQPTEPASDTGRPIREYFRDLLAWQPQAAATPVSEATTAEEAFDEWFGSAEPAPEEVSATAQQEPSPDTEAKAEGSDDDDDLEMFRSWLQSLKK